MNTTIQVNYIEGFNQQHLVKANQAIQLVQDLVNSNAFKEAVLSVRRFKNPRVRRRTGRRRYSNQEILDLILGGRDLNNPADQIMNFRLRLYDSQVNEIGNTNMTTLIISTFKGYLEDNAVGCYAAHLLHEYMHTIGFTHSRFDIFGRDRTVPYKIGKIARDLLGADC
ncbi:hypothetical protein [Aquimarina sp. AU474]|uniref:hypothetical protein n=1 Tax=Aquimarina sp. AU474 TaxID=2108529 RepID=UPI000D696E3B|nr:hypothetical protein [Aquimarina sp. AU474]